MCVRKDCMGLGRVNITDDRTPGSLVNVRLDHPWGLRSSVSH